MEQREIVDPKEVESFLVSRQKRHALSEGYYTDSPLLLSVLMLSFTALLCGMPVNKGPCSEFCLADIGHSAPVVVSFLYIIVIITHKHTRTRPPHPPPPTTHLVAQHADLVVLWVEHAAVVPDESHVVAHLVHERVREPGEH